MPFFVYGPWEEVSMRELIKVMGSVTGRKAVVNDLSNVKEDTSRLVADILKNKSL